MYTNTNQTDKGDPGHRNSSAPKLYLFVPGQAIYAWQVDMVERLVFQQAIQDVAYIDTGRHECIKPPLFISVLYAIDRRMAHCIPETLEKKNIENLSGRENQKFNLEKHSIAEFLQNIQHETDASAIVINLSEKNLDDALLRKIALPVLSTFMGNDPKVISALTGIFEYIAAKKMMASGIQIESPGNKNRRLFCSTTSLESPSFCKNINACLKKTSVFMARTIHQLRAHPELFSQPRSGEMFSKSVTKRISIYNKAALLIRYLSNIVGRIIKKLTVDEQWIILLGKNTSDNKPNLLFSSFKKIIPPNDQFWADPFLFEYQNRHYLFVEVYPYDTQIGYLSCIEIKEDGSWTEPVKVLQRPYHLSYPNVFEFDGIIYMLPETGDNNTIELYEATDFPYQWKLKHVLVENIRAYDSTILFHDGLWWLFATVSESKDCPSTEELYIFYADSPISQHWKAHLNNPLVSDASSARPAGKIYQSDDGRLIRPSQDCAGSYGAAINLCEIQTLNKQCYKEKIVKKYSPTWDNALVGMHTLNFDRRYTVIDAVLEQGKGR